MPGEPFIPYLGPDPPAGRHLGRTVVAVGILAACTRLVAAGLYVQRAQVDARLTIRGTARLDLDDTLRTSNSRMASAGTAWVVTAVALLVLQALWLDHRRRRSELVEHGEAYVAAPLQVAVPKGARLAPLVALGLGWVLGWAGRSPAPTRPSRLVAARLWSAGSAACFAASALLWALWPVLAERSHDRRRRASIAYRRDPTWAPYIEPVGPSPPRIRRGSAGC